MTDTISIAWDKKAGVIPAIEEYNRLTALFKTSQFIVTASRPGTGKTTFGASIAAYLAAQKILESNRLV